VSITSLCETLPEKNTVFFCSRCGHLQTEPIANLEAYYDQTYKMLIESDEEDQLYAVVDGREIFRTDHQVDTLLSKVRLPAHARVLDYGCAKSSTLKRLLTRRADLVPHVFDVSEMYLRFWEKFVPRGNWATYTPKPQWNGYFDLVTSFFALEHVVDPCALLRKVFALLKPGGKFYLIVPNVTTNAADFVVADHVNHFSASSLERLLLATGFEPMIIDDKAHTSAWVVVAKKSAAAPIAAAGLPPTELTHCVHDLAAYWSGFAQKLQAFERSHSDREHAAIYGSGFYGTFLATCLNNLERVVCFLDRNPHRQNKTLLGKAILPPEQLPPGVELIYVGLNPVHARAGIQTVTAWREKSFTFFYP